MIHGLFCFHIYQEDFFYLSKRSRPRWNMPCMAFHQGLNCLPVYRLSSIKNENGLMITWYILFCFHIYQEDFFYLSKRSRPRWNMPCMAFHQGLNCLPVYQLSSIKNENGLMITWYMAYSAFIFIKKIFSILANGADPDEICLVWHFIKVLTVCQCTGWVVLRMKMV